MLLLFSELWDITTQTPTPQICVEEERHRKIRAGFTGLEKRDVIIPGTP